MIMSLHASDEGFSFCLQALLSLCSDELVSAKSALDLCINQMKKVLSSQQLPENASVETIGRAYHVTETLVQVCYLCYAPCLSGSRLFSTVVVYASCLKVYHQQRQWMQFCLMFNSMGMEYAVLLALQIAVISLMLHV